MIEDPELDVPPLTVHELVSLRRRSCEPREDWAPREQGPDPFGSSARLPGIFQRECEEHADQG